MDPGWRRVVRPPAAPRRSPPTRRTSSGARRNSGSMRLRWPQPFPAEDQSWALLAATYAKWIGRGVAFSLAALRQAFAAGRDLSQTRQCPDRRRRVRDAPERGPSRASGWRARRKALKEANAARGESVRRDRAARDLDRRPRPVRRAGDPGVRANRAYELIVHRQGRFFRPSDSIEQVEVLEIDTGEVDPLLAPPGPATRGSSPAPCAPTWRSWRRTSSLPSGASIRPGSRPSAHRAHRLRRTRRTPPASGRA